MSSNSSTSEGKKGWFSKMMGAQDKKTIQTTKQPGAIIPEQQKPQSAASLTPFKPLQPSAQEGAKCVLCFVSTQISRMYVPWDEQCKQHLVCLACWSANGGGKPRFCGLGKGICCIAARVQFPIAENMVAGTEQGEGHRNASERRNSLSVTGDIPPPPITKPSADPSTVWTVGQPGEGKKKGKKKKDQKSAAMQELSIYSQMVANYMAKQESASNSAKQTPNLSGLNGSSAPLPMEDQTPPNLLGIPARQNVPRQNVPQNVPHGPANIRTPREEAEDFSVSSLFAKFGAKRNVKAANALSGSTVGGLNDQQAKKIVDRRSEAAAMIFAGNEDLPMHDTKQPTFTASSGGQGLQHEGAAKCLAENEVLPMHEAKQTTVTASSGGKSLPAAPKQLLATPPPPSSSGLVPATHSHNREAQQNRPISLQGHVLPILPQNIRGLPVGNAASKEKTQSAPASPHHTTSQPPTRQTPITKQPISPDANVLPPQPLQPPQPAPVAKQETKLDEIPPSPSPQKRALPETKGLKPAAIDEKTRDELLPKKSPAMTQRPSFQPTGSGSGVSCTKDMTPPMGATDPNRCLESVVGKSAAAAAAAGAGAAEAPVLAAFQSLRNEEASAGTTNQELYNHLKEDEERKNRASARRAKFLATECSPALEKSVTKSTQEPCNENSILVPPTVSASDPHTAALGSYLKNADTKNFQSLFGDAAGHSSSNVMVQADIGFASEGAGRWVLPDGFSLASPTHSAPAPSTHLASAPAPSVHSNSQNQSPPRLEIQIFPRRFSALLDELQPAEVLI